MLGLYETDKFLLLKLLKKTPYHGFSNFKAIQIALNFRAYSSLR